MLKNRGRDPRSAVPSTPLSVRSVTSRSPMTKPEPDYEVVEFQSDQYVNAKMQAPPPPPPRPPTGHPVDAGASCGLCGGGGARVRCAECGRRALCASCDDMYHRHPKRRHHQRQALSHSQLLDERPPLPPKVAPPVPPPRRHKISGERTSASPRPQVLDQRRATLNIAQGAHNPTITNTNHFATQRAHVQHPQPAVTNMTAHMGSMPYLPNAVHHANAPVASQEHSFGPFSSWGRPRASLPGFNMAPNMVQQQPHPLEPWERQENVSTQSWGRPLRRGTSVMELGGGPTGCSGCIHCAGNPWRYGSCANLDHQWLSPSPGPGLAAWPQTCCSPHAATHNPRMLPQPHVHHPPQTPQPYRRIESRASRAASRAGSRAASPALSVRSRTSRRSKHRTPSPPLPSSDADSESEVESDRVDIQDKEDENSLGPAPPPPISSWQCEHCTFVNEPGVRVCAVCCRTPTVKPKIIADVVKNGVTNIKITERTSDSPSSPSNRVAEQSRIKNDSKINNTRSTKERTSTGCGPSPPRENKPVSKTVNKQTTPLVKEQSNDRIESKRIRHDIAVGPSPPKELQDRQKMSSSKNNTTNQTSNKFGSSTTLDSPVDVPVKSHSISIGPSPPRDSPKRTMSSYQSNSINFQKKSVGNSPPRENIDIRPSSRSSRTTTGTSPPPQSISTQTYEVPSNWERAQSVTRSRSSRRLRDENRRERSHSRLSLSSDTRDSERSVHTTGGRWEWREPRDSSPSADWSESERQRATRLTRRASHLDVRRRPARRSSVYGSEAPSPEPLSNNRAISLEALAGSRREAERGLELARLMTEAERLGFSAAEVHAALAQNPVAPLAWLSERWPSLVAGVRAAAARLAPGVTVTELEARASLARHRGAMWPAVNECVERYRRQAEMMGVGEEGRMRGHVWGPPTGVDDEGAPPSALSSRIHRTREDSSDEFEVTTNKFQDDDWMYLPLEINTKTNYELEQPIIKEHTNATNVNTGVNNCQDIAGKLKTLLIKAGIPLGDENLLLKGLLGNRSLNLEGNNPTLTTTSKEDKPNVPDLIQSENDFIAAYNALTRLSPLPSLNNDVTGLNENIKQLLTENDQENIDNTSANQIKDANVISKPKNSESQLTPIDKMTNEKFKEVHERTNLTGKSITSKNNNDNKKLVQIDHTKNINDKTTNLNDIVDNTQKLIQQMKKEINSDITYIDNNSNTQSEVGDSSNDMHSSSEKESSFSDTDGNDTEDLSSDEKDTSTSAEEDPSNQLHTRISVQRTSSEDNDNFEEAMDHVDNELEDFKQTNIEMLNSIARSLQEEHTMTIELNKPKEQIRNSQDVNNNLFAAVNSFEEIYAELNNNGQKNEKNKVHNYIDRNHKKNTVNNDNETKVKTKFIPEYTRHNITTSYFKPDSPTKLIVTDQVPHFFTAYIENLVDSLNVENRNSPEPDYSDRSQEIVDESLKEVIENNIPDEGTQSNFRKGLGNKVETLEKHESVPVIVSTLNTNNENTITEGLNQTSSLSPKENTIENTLMDRKAEIFDNNILSDSKHQDISAPTENEFSFHSHIKENPDKLPFNGNEKLKSPPVTNKSNIPKLIKTIQSPKQKMEGKNLPKLITSKVPIRRASLKHYPAPNPPKGRFGNVQSGQVKQLQTRLFNDKVMKTNKDSPSMPKAIASTSKITKKNPAPHPPLSQESKQSQQQETSVVKKKNEFFRETCRTEDEWTDSDKEEQVFQINLYKEEESIPTPLSPIQPVTLRQISGQLIDLANVRLPEGSPERQARMLLAEGATETWDQAQLAVNLIAQGTDPPAALLAALECADLTSALAYLHQDCELCASKFPEHEMVSMLRCTHRCCRECARHYFTVQITERSIVDCVCPYCKEPELENLPEDDWLDYFAHMDILLKTLLDIEVHELFQRKLRDRTLAKDPNFKWCVECSSGFFVHPKQKKLRCPECKSITCSSCRKKWTVNHDGVTCEQYATWLEDNDPERSIAAVQQHLRENGLECPRCRFKYSLSRGGCMHFTCTQCKYEFCYGCGKPFTMGARCGLSDYCAKLGLHAHHPRNCLFYLRDKEPQELQTLLQMNNVTYETQATESSNNRCPIQLQRETPTGLVDTTCGNEVQANQAGLCKMHYVEYLAGLARALDPIPIMEVSELVAELRRRALPLPERGPWDTDPIYAGMCAEIVREKIPLD